MSENSLTWNFIGKDKVSRVAETIGGKLGSVGKTIGLAFGGAAVAGVAALGATLLKGAKDAAEYQVIAATTAQVIKTTGNVARVSVAGLEAMAGSLESLSGVDETLILHGENVLLTFTNIRNAAGKGNDIFNQATKAALNLSVALGQDMQSSAIQVGKALNDPIKGITALQRVGVSFTQQQKDQAAAMVKSGNIMGAQKLILAELNKEFGGAAKAAGSGLAGAIAHLQDVWSDFWRDQTGRFMPQITAIVRQFADLLPGALSTAVGALEGIASAIRRVDWSGLVSGARNAVAAAQHEFLVINLSGIAARLLASAKSWGQALINGIREGMRTGDWSTLGQTIGAGITTAIGRIGQFLYQGVSKLTELFGKLFEKIDWVGIGITIGKQAPSLLIGLALGLLNFDLFGLLKGLASHWQDVLLAIIAVAFTPGKIIGKVVELLARIPLAGRLLAWGLEHFAAFSKGLVKMVGEALGFLSRSFIDGFRRVFPGIGVSFGQALKILPLRLAVIALEIQEAIGRMIVSMATTIVRFIGRVVAAIGELIGRMIRPFLNADTWLVGHGVRFINGLLRGIANGARAIGGAIAGHIRTLISPFARAGSWLIGHGGELISGFLSGARNALKAVGSWASGIKDSIVGWIKNKFGISSPSKVFMELGGHMIGGLVRGLMSADPAKFISAVFGNVDTALGAIVNKGWVSLKSLPSTAISALAGVAGKVGGLIKGLFSDSAGGKVGAGVERWRSLALQALAYTHSPPNWINAMLRRMNQESGGNPMAINLNDINAQHGDPSRGLMQTIGSTFNQYAGELRGRGIYDPFANMVASIRYANAAYGQAITGWNRAGGYDQGGYVMPGWTPLYNGTGKPEHMFTDKNLDDIAARMGGGGTTIIFQHSGPLIGTDVDTWMVGKLDQLKRQRRIS